MTAVFCRRAFVAPEFSRVRVDMAVARAQVGEVVEDLDPSTIEATKGLQVS